MQYCMSNILSYVCIQSHILMLERVGFLRSSPRHQTHYPPVADKVCDVGIGDTCDTTLTGNGRIKRNCKAPIAPPSSQIANAVGYRFLLLQMLQTQILICSDTIIAGTNAVKIAPPSFFPFSIHPPRWQMSNATDFCCSAFRVQSGWL